LQLQLRDMILLSSGDDILLVDLRILSAVPFG